MVCETLHASVGSPNYYDDSALTNANIDAAYKTLLGTTPVFDTANAEYIVLLDASGDETVRPVEVKEFQKVREKRWLCDGRRPAQRWRRYARRRVGRCASRL